MKAFINKNVRRHLEDSLDKRLRHVYDRNTNSFHLVNASSGKKRHGQPGPDLIHHHSHSRQIDQHMQSQHQSNPSYAYTRQSNVSPIRPANPGDKNTPMCYVGPPTHAEINRNMHRANHQKNASSTLQQELDERDRRSHRHYSHDRLPAA